MPKTCCHREKSSVAQKNVVAHNIMTNEVPVANKCRPGHQHWALQTEGTKEATQIGLSQKEGLPKSPPKLGPPNRGYQRGHQIWALPKRGYQRGHQHEALQTEGTREAIKIGLSQKEVNKEATPKSPSKQRVPERPSKLGSPKKRPPKLGPPNRRYQRGHQIWALPKRGYQRGHQNWVLQTEGTREATKIGPSKQSVLKR